MKELEVKDEYNVGDYVIISPNSDDTTQSDILFGFGRIVSKQITESEERIRKDIEYIININFLNSSYRYKFNEYEIIGKYDGDFWDNIKLLSKNEKESNSKYMIQEIVCNRDDNRFIILDIFYNSDNKCNVYLISSTESQEYFLAYEHELTSYIKEKLKSSISISYDEDVIPVDKISLSGLDYNKRSNNNINFKADDKFKYNIDDIVYINIENSNILKQFILPNTDNVFIKFKILDREVKVNTDEFTMKHYYLCKLDNIDHRYPFYIPEEDLIKYNFR